jgi:hypothetical protein
MMRIFYMPILNGVSAKMVLMPVARKIVLRANIIARVFKSGMPTIKCSLTGRLYYKMGEEG